jgi:hypothetical protein
MNALDETLKAAMDALDPNGSLNLSKIDFGIEGARKVASFLRKW